MTTKICKKCGQPKPIDEFYERPRMADGHLNSCKECTKAYEREYRQTHDIVRERDKIRQRDPARKAYTSARSKSWNARNPEKYKAHYLVSNAIRDGRLSKMPCKVCGETNNVHGHHDDYSKPLEVTWLCVRHHAILHGARIRGVEGALPW